MRRILIAAGLALLAHGFLLVMGTGWLKRGPLEMPKPELVTLTLATYPPQKAETEVRQAPQQKKKEEQKPDIKPKPLRKTPKRPAPVKSPQPPKKEVYRPKTEIEPQPITEEGEVTHRGTGPSTDAPQEKTSPAEPTAALKGPAQTSVRQAIPIYKENPLPHYPKAARRRGYEGTTLLEVLVNREGTVDDVRLALSSGYAMLDRAAKASVRKWVFIPAMRGNEKVVMWVKIPIRFQLK